MRVILSRKGFDSQYGGVPSPILPDGRMISLPIPAKDAPTPYDAMQRDGLSFGKLVGDLTRGRVEARFRGHLDPDLDPAAVSRPRGWRPLFGQADASLGHLRKAGVEVGDLFLFFGWFRRAELVGDRWRFVAGSPSFHALWGWLLIAEMYAVSELPKDIRRWAAGHPHLAGMPNVQNGVFIAGQEFSIGRRRHPGAGLFPFAQHRVLTTPGASRSTWEMPAWMHPVEAVATLSYHGDVKRWSAVDGQRCRLQAVSKGQEFVLTSSDEGRLQDWLASVFSGS